MKSDIISFNLEKAPLFYVCGEFEGLESWTHKRMYQPGNWELSIVLEGALYLEIEGEQYAIHENEYILVPPYKNLKGFKPCPVGSKFVFIHFFPNGEVTFSDSTKQNDYYVVNIPRQSTIFNKDSILSSAYQILELYQTKEGHILDLSVAELSTLIDQDYKELIEHKRSSSAGTSIENIKTWISAHLSEIETSQDVADAFNFTAIYLNRIFKRSYGQSLYQYVISQKIQRAKLLLETSDETIYEISQEVYFKDSKNFSNAFKSRVGISPRNYRDSYNQRSIHTPTYDPVVPVSDKVMERVLNSDFQTTPYGKSPRK